MAQSLPGTAGGALAAAAKSAYVSAMTVSLVAGAIVAVAAAVMVRRFYPDQIVMHDHGAHGHAPAPAPAAVAATDGDGHVPADEPRPLGELEGVGER